LTCGQEEGCVDLNEFQVHSERGGVCGPQYGVDVGSTIALEQSPESVILNFERPHTWPAAAEVWCAIRSR
jgi:hypothetical protein